ncbi:glutathione S-transferase [Rhizobium pisi]|uniref:Glutathione S-transferase n=2 Tax=Rhizobium TaxID=379 RepID=A0A7W6BII3_9HYPH|nr:MULTISPECIES: glutathione S-transferase [Rhizobium]MBB3136348.1 glutathione S-transferase [Rhizobium pisi]MBB3919649.1 glutathione S-transferase [Rhizobium fabae]RSB72080.1 glutathione S-transferase [Rhizobium pisi]RUM05964.1 glutathione S-transferase [Rhizobium fabae]TCA51518.1 glutathione S-transferase [Rhizobium pisi]
MKLLCSPASPYSSKVRMAAHFLGLEVNAIRVDTNTGPAILVDNNPLGKIPTLLTDDGASIFDSVAIMHFFDRLTKGGLYPSKKGKRTDAEVLEALCDGICDCLLAIVYERRFRDEEKVHQPWIDRQWKKATAGLAHLGAKPPKTGKKLNGGHFALAATLDYLDLRFKGQWEADHAPLIEWLAQFEKKFPAHRELKASA